MTQTRSDFVRHGALSRLIAGVAIMLALLTGAGALTIGTRFTGGTTPLLSLPWVQPTAQALIILSSLAVALLCSGRFRILGSPWLFWASLAFVASATIGIPYLLTWPGLLGDRGLITSNGNTAAWLSVLWNLPVTPLWLAIYARRPERLGLSSLLAACGIATALAALAALFSVLYQDFLPALIDGVAVKPLAVELIVAVAIMNAVSAVVAYHRHRREREATLGHLALFFVVNAYGLLYSVLGGSRYDPWWYCGRLLLVVAPMVLLFGLLLEYVDLYRRERDRTVELLGILKSSPDAIFVTDREGRVRFASQTGLGVLQVGKVEEIPDQLSEWVSAYQTRGADGTPLSAGELPLARVARGETFNGWEVQYRDLRQGTVAWQLISGGPLLDEQGNPTGGILIGTDITERKHAEEALRESEERLRTMANAIPQLAWMAHPDGFIYWYNQRWYEYTGTTPEEMEGWGWQSVHDPGVLPAVLERWKTSIATGEPFDMEFPLKGADGRFRWFLTRVAPLKGTDGRVLHWFGTNTDINERLEVEHQRKKLLEAEHEARVLAEKAARARDEYIAVVSHEIRTPLTSIKGFAQMLLRQIEREKGIDRARLVKAAEAAWIESERLSTLAGRLVTASDLESGDFKLIRGRADLSALVETVVSKARRLYPKRAIRLSEDGAVSADIDPTRLAQVLAGLVENAVKFSPAGSPIEVGVGSNERGGAVISVSDKGGGIPDAELDKIFERYYRALPYRQYGGVGLGLYLAKQIVEMHGGTITVEQPADGGSRFTIHIPTDGEH